MLFSKKCFKSVNKPGVKLKASAHFNGLKKNSYHTGKKYKYTKNQVGHRKPRKILI